MIFQTRNTAERSRSLNLPSKDGSSAKLSFIVALILVFSAPTDIVLTNVGSPVTVYLFEALAWSGFAIVALASLSNRASSIVTTLLTRLPYVCGYLVICSLSAIIASGYNGSGDTVGKVKNLIPAVMFAAILTHTITSRQRLQLTLLTINLALVLNAILGIFQFSTGVGYIVTPIIGIEWKTDPYGNLLLHTANGFFSAPNNLGPALAAGIVMAARVAVCRGSIPRSALSLGSALIMLFGLYLTFNKGGLVFTFVGLAVAFIPPRWTNPWLTLALVLFTASLIVIFALMPSSELATNTILVRIHLWYAAMTIFDSYPSVLIFGDGLKYMTYAASTFADWKIATSHNTWLDQILFYGLPGLTAYILLWFNALSTASLTARLQRGGLATAVSCGMNGCLAALAGELIFEPRADGSFQIAQVFMYFGIAASQLCIAIRAKQGEADLPDTFQVGVSKPAVATVPR